MNDPETQTGELIYQKLLVVWRHKTSSNVRPGGQREKITGALETGLATDQTF